MQTDWLQTDNAPQTLPMNDADVRYWAQAFETNHADSLLEALFKQLHWEQRSLRIYNKTHLTPRLVAWCADNGVQYEYSGDNAPRQDWTSALLTIKAQVETLCNARFNGALLNYYRNGNDHMGWHSDDESSLGKQPVIASVSLGAQRTFQFKHKTSKQRVDIELEHGSLLVMQGNTQKYWQHALPKRLRENEARLNVTFRCIQ